MKTWSRRPLWMRVIGAAICFFLFIEVLQRQIGGFLAAGLVGVVLGAQYLYALWVDWRLEPDKRD